MRLEYVIQRINENWYKNQIYFYPKVVWTNQFSEFWIKSDPKCRDLLKIGEKIK